jgi:hypothetical protein
MVLLLPHILWLVRTPKIVGEVVPDEFFNHGQTQHFVIQNVHPKFSLKKDLNIWIMSGPNVNKIYKAKFKDKTEVLGFTEYKENTIWCIDDVRVLIHELRHVFEGDYHR